MAVNQARGAGDNPTVFLASGALFGAFEGDDLAGVMGLLPEARAATAHRAWIVTVYVRLMCVPPGAERPSRGIFWLR